MNSVAPYYLLPQYSFYCAVFAVICRFFFEFSKTYCLKAAIFLVNTQLTFSFNFFNIFFFCFAAILTVAGFFPLSYISFCLKIVLKPRQSIRQAFQKVRKQKMSGKKENWNQTKFSPTLHYFRLFPFCIAALVIIAVCVVVVPAKSLLLL